MRSPLVLALVLLSGLIVLDGARPGKLRAGPSGHEVTKDLVPCTPGTGAHQCGKRCGLEVPVRKANRRPVAPGGFAQVLLAGVGEEVAIELEEGSGSRKLLVEGVSPRPDGRVALAGRLNDGRILYLVSDGESWEGRLESADRRRVWLLAGDREAGTIEERPRATVLCSAERDGIAVAGLPPIFVPGPRVQERQEDSPAVAEAQPILNSLPGAAGVIYLDFDGETVSGTQWNASFTNNATIEAGESGFTNAQIQLVWEAMSEDYRPFNINITTDRAVYNAYPTNRKTMVIFTPDNEWYGASGGVAYVDIFGSLFYDEPAWVFTDQLLSGGVPHAPFAAEAGSHEAGHVLGLSHDGISGEEYYSGHGSGATSWGPIMGASYQVAVSQWSRGEYSGATNTENDLAIIASTRNGLGYRVDDHSGSPGSATPLARTGEAVFGSGLIERTTDVDVFSLETGGGALSITASNDPTDPNLDISLRLLDASGGEVAVAGPFSSLDATLSASVPAGTYYIEVEGVGTGNPSSGWSDYASLGAYTITGTVPDVNNQTAEILSPVDAGVSLPEGVGLIIEGSAAGGEISWQVIQAPTGGSVQFSSPNTASTRCEFSALGVYQLRLRVDSSGGDAQDDLFVSVEAHGTSKVYPNRGPSIGLGPDRNVYDVSEIIDAGAEDDGVPAPTQLSYEWTILSGNGSLSANNVEAPVLNFGAPDTVSLRVVAGDGQIATYAEVHLTGRFLEEQLIDTGSPIKVLVPRDGTVDSVWRSIEFADSSWLEGVQGVGYDANNGPSSRRIYDPLIALDVESQMYQAAAGCYVRVPFTINQSGRVLALTLRMKYDDGFVAYLNGVEVARGNVPTGPVAWNSLASSDRNDEAGLSYQTFTLSVPPGTLVDGRNVLALHGLNSAVARNERGFVMVGELEALLKESPYLETIGMVTDPTQTNTGDDPDGDGADNLAEHATGTDPARVDRYEVIAVRPGEAVRLTLPDVGEDDVRYALERSFDLSEGSWSAVATRDGAGEWSGLVPTTVLPAGDGYEQILFDLGAPPRVFYRLRFELITP